MTKNQVAVVMETSLRVLSNKPQWKNCLFLDEQAVEEMVKEGLEFIAREDGWSESSDRDQTIDAIEHWIKNALLRRKNFIYRSPEGHKIYKKKTGRNADWRREEALEPVQ